MLRPIAIASAVVVAAPGYSQATPSTADAAALCAGAASIVAPGGPTRSTLAAAPVTLTNRWASAGRTTFSHVIDGAPGRIKLTLETCSSASGGETVAIYPATASGERMPRRPRVMFSIAVPRGNVRQATASIAPARAGAKSGSLHFAVVIENASGKFHQGAYRLTVSR